MSRRWSVGLAGAAALASAGAILAFAPVAEPAAAAGEAVVLAPVPRVVLPEAPGLRQAEFAGGCFWGVTGVFSHVAGVVRVVSGYEGGVAATAHYERIEAGDTGHAEAVRITYDPAKVSYGDLLRVFFSVVADPTQLNRQGPDTGTQYRSALVPLDAAQAQMAAAYLAQLRGAHLWPGAIVTRIEPDKGFFPAEAYHQNFMADNPDYPYIAYWDVPKVDALKRLFPRLYMARAARA
jgi:peptide-methionine (S)-S-oxide reductase